jgi:hypothetical protein
MLSSLIAIFAALFQSGSAKTATVTLPSHPHSPSTIHSMDVCSADSSSAACKTYGGTAP